MDMACRKKEKSEALLAAVADTKHETWNKERGKAQIHQQSYAGARAGEKVNISITLGCE
jgi:hypothetical protein